jgi:NAD(P)-dependent dehydrogenase (short-subunit alcohol dehydrogenase family)
MSATASLDGKAALVTGSSRGIGRAIAVELARRGADVVVHGRAGGAQAEAVLQEVSRLGRRGLVLSGDVTDVSVVAGWATTIEAELGRLDILVNNAAYVAPSQIPVVDVDTWRRIIDVDLNGPFYVAKAMLELLARSAGSIVNIGSLSSRDISRAGGAAYAAAKAGLVAMTRTGAAELAALGIRMNLVAPPLTDTEMGSWARGLTGDAATGLASGQRAARPEEVAAVVAFLCEPASSYLSGETIYMGGGYGRPAT